MKNIDKKYAETKNLLDIYSELITKLGDIPEQKLSLLASSARSSLDLYNRIITGEHKGVGPKKATSNLKQSLIEIELIILSLSTPARDEAAKIYYQIINTNLPDLLNNPNNTAKKIKARGYIKTHEEYMEIKLLIDHPNSSNNSIDLQNLILLTNSFETEKILK